MKEADFKRKARPGVPDVPVYSPGLDIEDVKRKFGVERVVKLASNENPLGASAAVYEAVKAEAEKVHLYPDGSCFNLRDALSDRLGVPGECLIFGNGTDEIIDFVCYAFFDPGDNAVMGDPTFSSYYLSAMTMGAEIVKVPLREYRHDVGAMLASVDERTKAVFVGTPHNPTGTIVTRVEMEKMLEGLPPDVLLVWDEAYREYVQSPDYPDTVPYIRDFPNLLILRTFSKIYGLAGLRVGYGIGDPRLIDVLERVRPPFNVNRIAQAAALAALSDDEHVEKSRSTNSRGRVYLSEELQAVGMEVVPSEANFVLVRYDTVVENLSEKLIERGIIVRDGASLGYPGYVRITVGTREENEYLLRAIREIVRADR